MTDLDLFIHERRDATFSYFERDCATLAADWVREKRGDDPLAPLRASGGPLAQRKLLAALRFVRASGGFEQAGSALLGPSKPGLMAFRGDVVLARSGRAEGRVSGFSFGICTGSHIVAPGPNQLEFLPFTAGVAAWAI